MRRTWRELRHDISLWLLKAGSVAAVLGIGYLIWGGLRGYFYAPPDPTRVASVTNILSFFLYCCGWAISLGLVGSFWDWRPIGITILASTAFLWFLIPTIFVAITGIRNPISLQGAEALRALLIPALLVGFVQFVWTVIYHLRHGFTLRARVSKGAQLVFRKKGEEKRLQLRRPLLTPFSPCWKLPIMDKLMCQHCPVMDRRRPCWRLKGGCQCNSSVVEAMLFNLSEKEGLSVSAFSTGSLMSWQKGQNPPCHRCNIFLLHQQIKYDWLAPITFLAPPILLVRFWENYVGLYSKAAGWLNQIWHQIAFAPPTSLDPLGLNDMTTMVFIAIVLCVLVMVYTIRAIEFGFFKLFL